MAREDVFIHESANVSAQAEIGRGTKIWINSQVREDVTIGQDCIISKDTYIDKGVRIGNRVKIQNGVSVYQGVEIDDDAFVGPNVAFTNDLRPRSFNKEWKITPTFVGRGSSIGANATIVCGITIGKYAMVGAGSVVTRDVPPHGLVVGNPASLLAYVCRCGARVDREGLCPECGERIEATKGMIK
jgi:UDP-2-acetamido-3-amino-2,3-dideoxy-glucuronate N-acetyltransferase